MDDVAAPTLTSPDPTLTLPAERGGQGRGDASPAEELGLLVGWASSLFYWAEVGENPSMRTYWDAVHYVATSLSVGYANIFPVTALGKAIGAVVMMVGPALSARVLEPAPSTAGAADLTPVLERLDAILEELRRR